MRVVGGTGSRARMTLGRRRVDHYLVVSARDREVLVAWQERHRVPPARALGEAPGGREFVGLDLAAKTTEQARHGVCVPRSPAR